MTLYGYARVSTDGQTLDAQVAALKAAGAERVFSEKQSGAKTDRTALAKALAALSAGDVLVVTRLDRLARSTRDLLNVLATVSERGTGFRSLGDPWADTTTPTWKVDADCPRWSRRVRAELSRKRREAGEALTDIGRSFNVSHSTISRL
jgi:DNA invertase Pin-like site-specific DNA recombinase